MSRSSLVAGTALALALLSVPATAHVSIDPKHVKAGSVRLAFRIPHGCEGSPTTAVKITIPDGIIGVKPAPKPGWTVTMQKGVYARAYSFHHGKKLSEGVKEIVWSGGSLADDMFDEFLVSGFVSGEAFKPGADIAFSVTQTCEKGSLAWTEVAAGGTDPHDLKFPAPLLRVTSENSYEVSVGVLSVSAAWARATPEGATVGAGYLTISNSSTESDRLLSASSPAAARVEIHDMQMHGDIMKMRKIEDGLKVPTAGKVELKPGGLHLMFFDLAAPLVDGNQFELVLKFEKKGDIRVQVPVLRDPPSTATGGGHHQH
jgi:periplasmic copper chaperone A